jgi:hypothetical protein
MKTVVLDEIDNHDIVYSRKLLDLAAGKVERPFRYVREGLDRKILRI